MKTILEWRKKYRESFTLEKSKERMRMAVLCCALRKAWCDEFAKEICLQKQNLKRNGT